MVNLSKWDRTEWKGYHEPGIDALKEWQQEWCGGFQVMAGREGGVPGGVSQGREHQKKAVSPSREFEGRVPSMQHCTAKLYNGGG